MSCNINQPLTFGGCKLNDVNGDVSIAEIGGDFPYSEGLLMADIIYMCSCVSVKLGNKWIDADLQSMCKRVTQKRTYDQEEFWSGIQELFLDKWKIRLLGSYGFVFLNKIYQYIIYTTASDDKVENRINVLENKTERLLQLWW